VWEKQGVIETTPGRAIQYDWVAERIGKIAVEYNILGIAFDRWRIDDLLNAMSKIGLEAYVDGKDEARVGAIRMVPWGQGYASMTQAVEAMEVSILERKLIHDANACMTWNISNAMALSDAAGNRKLDKSASRFRIDGAVALAMCLGLKSRDRMEQPEPSAYEGMTKEEILKSMAF
jgi:phage terminase large subunit-like protein